MIDGKFEFVKFIYACFAKCSSRMCYYCVIKERNSRIYLILTVASIFTRFESD